MSAQWPTPDPGDFLWSHFPQDQNKSPGPKPRPVLVVSVVEREDGIAIAVVPGTSQKVTSLREGEVAITKLGAPSAYKLAGLSFDTKFDFKIILELPWSDEFFKTPPAMPYGNNPKVGTLHAEMVRPFAAAFNAA